MTWEATKIQVQSQKRKIYTKSNAVKWYRELSCLLVTSLHVAQAKLEFATEVKTSVWLKKKKMSSHL